MSTHTQQHTDRPGTDELVVRYRLARRSVREINPGIVTTCRTTDPELFFPDDCASLGVRPFRKERQAIKLCDGCPLIAACLVQEMREAPSVFQVTGVRAGLAQAERRALYLFLDEKGLR